jgi:hypothetical protein
MFLGFRSLVNEKQAELGIGYQVLNEISGLSYVDKLLAPMPVGGEVAPNGRCTARGIGPTSLGPLLGGLAVKLVPIEDPDQTGAQQAVRQVCPSGRGPREGCVLSKHD